MSKEPNPIFDDNNLNKFLNEFDAIRLKYGIDNDDDMYDDILDYEKAFIPTDYTKKDTVSFLENTSLVYGGNEVESNKFLWRYKNASDKLLKGYIGIWGLSRLFDERYIEFEWDMHSRMDFREHSPSYYRDHFIHQLRDCFMCYTFLRNEKIYSQVFKVLHNRTKSKVSRYFYDCIEQLKQKSRDKRCHYLLLLKIYRSSKAKGNKEFKDFLDEYFSKYIIFASIFIASLFHDIGYPIVHYFRYQKRLLKFAPSIYMLINGDKSSNEKIAALLSQTLLFQVVGKEEILYCGDENHGAFSAIALLLHFYETGLIYSLSIEQKAAVELAALAIYNHTNKYQYIIGDEKRDKCNYYRAQFDLNPISFLLRLCDDSQEWERTYFEISNTQTLRYCSQCHTPLLRVKGSVNNDEKDDIGSNCEKYICNCSNNLNSFRYKNTEFERRVIYNVTPSKCLRVYYSDRDYIVLDFDYDYFKLLRMCSISTTYAKLRTKELNYIKKLVDAQNIGYKNGIAVNFFMSCNPIFIKSFIIQCFTDLKNCKIPDDFIKSEDLDDASKYNELYKQFTEQNYNKFKQCIIDSFNEHKINCDLLKLKWLNEQIKFYFLTSEIGRCLSSYYEKSKIADIEIVKAKIKKYALNLYILYTERNGVKSKIILKLLEDALLQYSKRPHIEYNNCPNFSSKPFYFNAMKADDALLFDVRNYCSVTNALNIKKTDDIFSLDYYSDLYLFEGLNHIINLLRKK